MVNVIQKMFPCSFYSAISYRNHQSTLFIYLCAVTSKRNVVSETEWLLVIIRIHIHVKWFYNNLNNINSLCASRQKFKCRRLKYICINRYCTKVYGIKVNYFSWRFIVLIERNWGLVQHISTTKCQCIFFGTSVVRKRNLLRAFYVSYLWPRVENKMHIFDF